MMNTLNVPQDSASLGRLPIAAYLQGLVYPASREDVLRHAASHGATAQMQAMLGRLPSRQYINVTDLIVGYADSIW
jgi:hypothetical protein